ncbi:MAG TPA: DoxX-like family protein [Luteolibacter sp.]
MKSLRYFFAAVWLVNGLLCKVLDVVPRHREIVARILGEDHALALTRLIGMAEIGMALWILSGIKRKWSAWAQIMTVLAMNVIEFFLASDLLLFGKLNVLVALAFVALVAFSERLAKPEKSSANSCHSPS